MDYTAGFNNLVAYMDSHPDDLKPYNDMLQALRLYEPKNFADPIGDYRYLDGVFVYEPQEN